MWCQSLLKLRQPTGIQPVQPCLCDTGADYLMVHFAEAPTEGALRFGAAAQQEEASEDGSVCRLGFLFL